MFNDHKIKFLQKLRNLAEDGVALLIFLGGMFLAFAGPWMDIGAEIIVYFIAQAIDEQLALPDGTTYEDLEKLKNKLKETYGI